MQRKHIEIEWAEMIRGVEEGKKMAKSAGFLGMVRGKSYFVYRTGDMCQIVLTRNKLLTRCRPPPYVDLLRHVQSVCAIFCRNVPADRACLACIWPSNRFRGVFFIAYQIYFFSVSSIEKSFQFSIMNTCIGFMGINLGMVAIRSCSDADKSSSWARLLAESATSCRPSRGLSVRPQRRLSVSLSAFLGIFYIF